MALLKNYEIGHDAHYREIEADYEQTNRGQEVKKDIIGRIFVVFYVLWGIFFLFITFYALVIIQALGQ